MPPSDHTMIYHDATTNPSSLELSMIAAPYKDLMAKVQDSIGMSYRDALPLIGDIADHHFKSGGKRIRPLLTVVVSSLLRVDLDRACTLAACVELIHAASLMHDDVVDEAPFRHGKLSVKEKWGNRASILAGDYLLCQVFACLMREKSPTVYHILSRAAASITEGELQQTTLQRNLTIPLDTYIEMISQKTAALFIAACEVATTLTDTPDQHRQALLAYGGSLGRLFQLQDDYLDYEGDETTLGKKLGADLREGKVTFPVLFAYTHGSADDKLFWEQLFKEGYEHTPEDFHKIRGIFAACDLREGLVAAKARDFAMAQSALKELPNSPHRDTLSNLLTYVTYRRH